MFIMSEFLLSSVSVTELNPSPMSASFKGVSKSSVGLLVNGSEASMQKGGGFNEILSSLANQQAVISRSTLTKSDSSVNEKLLLAIENLVVALEQIAPDSGAIKEIRDFLNGQDMSTLGMDNKGDGASLPEFLSKLEAMIGSMLNEVDEGSELSISETLDEDGIASLESAFLQLNTAINEVTKKVGEPLQSSSSSLLGFSFTSGGGKGRDGQWQQYDPQQMSQSESQKTLQTDQQKIIPPESQRTLHSEAQKTLQSESKSLQSQNFMTDHLVSETDKNYKSQIQQLVPDIQSTLDAADPLVDTRIEARGDVQDKPSIKFSDLQLRTPNDGLKPYSTTLNTPVQSQQWNDEVNHKLVWFSGRNIQAAEMHLNPADLGPIDVKIHVHNDVTTVTFNAHNASVRDLLESNVVRLREMMEANGVNLGDVNVDSGSREQSQQSGSGAEQKGFGQSGKENGENTELVMGEQEIVIKQTNLVDYFV